MVEEDVLVAAARSWLAAVTTEAVRTSEATAPQRLGYE
jgi:hypothetical protein